MSSLLDFFDDKDELVLPREFYETAVDRRDPLHVLPTSDNKSLNPKESKKCQRISIFSQQTHAPGTFKCSKCGKISVSEKCHTTHLKIHTDGAFQCRYCPAIYLIKRNLSNHVQVEHQGKRFPCSVCDKEYKSASGLRYHEDEHKENFKLICELCGAGFVFRYKYEQHLSTCNPRIFSLQVKCSQCNKEFAHKRSLHQHLQICGLQAKPFQCQQCPKKFKAERYIKEHVQNCHADLKLPCSFCGKCHHSKKSLDLHIKRKHSQSLDNHMKRKRPISNIEEINSNDHLVEDVEIFDFHPETAQSSKLDSEDDAEVILCHTCGDMHSKEMLTMCNII